MPGLTSPMKAERRQLEFLAVLDSDYQNGFKKNILCWRLHLIHKG